MCNSSIHTNSSTFMLREVLQWHCICQDHFGTLVLNIIEALFLIFGMPVSSWCLWVFLHKNMTPNLVFSLNITVQELLFCFLCLFDVILANSISLPHYNLVVFFVGFFWTVRPLIQICMCVEHYLAVIHPVMFLRYKGFQYKIAPAVAAWLIGAGNSLRLISTETPFYPDHVFFTLFCIAVLIISFCCVSVLHALNHSGPGAQNNVVTDRGRAFENQQKKRAFRIISYNLVSILVSYTPQVVAYFMLISKISSRLYICKAFPIILSFTVITILLSPLIRMHSEGHMKKYHLICLSKLREIIKGK